MPRTASRLVTVVARRGYQGNLQDKVRYLRITSQGHSRTRSIGSYDPAGSLILFGFSYETVADFWLTPPIFPNPVPPKFVSQDRIFTNLYNDQSPYLKGAMARGDWHKTKELVLMGPEQIIADMKASGLRGAPWVPVAAIEHGTRSAARLYSATPRHCLGTAASAACVTCRLFVLRWPLTRRPALLRLRRASQAAAAPASPRA